MGGKKKKRRRKRSTKISLATVFGLAVGIARPIDLAIKGDPMRGLMLAGARYTGFDGRDGTVKFNMAELKNGLLPLVTGALISKFVGGRPLNLNQKLQNIPYVKI